MTIDSPFGPHVAFAAAAVGHGAEAELHPAEQAALSPRAIAKRRGEFAAGRQAARRCLAQLGHRPPPPVVPGADRAPRWPAATVGAITHTRGWAVACAAPTAACGGLGIDLEHVSGVRRMAIAPKIGAGDELVWVGDDRRRLTALFSAKEAVFKALYPRFGAFFGFHAVTMRWQGDAFHTRLAQALGPGYPVGTTLTVNVRWLDDPDYVLTSLALPPDGYPRVSG